MIFSRREAFSPQTQVTALLSKADQVEEELCKPYSRVIIDLSATIHLLWKIRRKIGKTEK